MSRDTVTLLTIFVSSPGDVAKERQALDKVVQRINSTDGQARGVHLEVFNWERAVVPQIGPLAQAVVNRQSPEYQIYLGIMAERFGTATSQYGSGTEEEFRTALTRWQAHGRPWIMFYFKKRALASDRSADVEEYLRVCRFKEELERQGLVTTYRSVRGSEDAFFEQVEMHLRQLLVRELVTPGETPLALTTPASGGGIDFRDPRHLVRREHLRAFSAIRKSRKGVLIRGPYESGKTSLLMAIASEAIRDGQAVVTIDLQLDMSDASEKGAYLRRIAELFAEAVGKTFNAEHWRQDLTPEVSLTSYIERIVLPDVPAGLLLCIDELDALQHASFREDFLQMLEGWQERGRRPNSRWQRFGVAVAMSSEFPVDALNGTVVITSDFNVDEVGQLNRLYGQVFEREEDLQRLFDWLGGHPLLTQIALNAASINPVETIRDDLFDNASDQNPFFGGNLRTKFHLLNKHAELKAGYEMVLDGTLQDRQIGERLRAYGLARLHREVCVPRCSLYEAYFRSRLRAPQQSA
jgi:hypothetical protein